MSAENAMGQWPKFPGTKSWFTPWTSEADEAAYTITVRTSGTGDVADTISGGALLISGAATTENSGASVQRNAANLTIAANQKTRFMTKFRTNEPTQSDIFAGMWETDTDPVGGVSNGVYFRKLDGETRLKIVHVKGGTETVGDTGVDLVADTDYEIAFQVSNVGSNGSTNEGRIAVFVNGVQKDELRVADVLASTVLMRESFHAESGSASGTYTCTNLGIGSGVGTFA